jgi:hypothetical protein
MGGVSSAALSEDGDTALLGARYREVNDFVGTAYVFTRRGHTWSYRNKLTGPGELGEGQFGESVALSADGGTALITAPNDNKNAGAAWVFTRDENVWTQQGEKLTGAGEVGTCSNPCFGTSAALSADGTTALIGGMGDNGDVGAAWVFTHSGSAWAQQGKKLTGNIASLGSFGFSVALSSDGNTALIGAKEEEEGIGAAWAFTRSGSTWIRPGEEILFPPVSAGEGEIFGPANFGSSVALSANAATALIGAPSEVTPYEDLPTGAVWAYLRR